MIIHPRMLHDYVIFMQKQCNELQQIQQEIEKKLIKVGSFWRDEVYVATENALRTVSRSVQKVHSGLAMSIKSATKYYNSYVEAQGYKQTIASVPIPEFQTRLKGEQTMDNFNKSNVTDLPSMKAFIDGLGKYIDETDALIRKIAAEHAEIGRCKAWVAPQYEQFGRVIQEVKVNIDKQLFSLDIARAKTKKSYIILAENEKRKI